MVPVGNTASNGFILIPQMTDICTWNTGKNIVVKTFTEINTLLLQHRRIWPALKVIFDGSRERSVTVRLKYDTAVHGCICTLDVRYNEAKVVSVFAHRATEC
jgi:hypothetical protein